MQKTLHARLYGDPEAYARERAGVFGRSWLCLGHEAEAPGPGDWIGGDIAGWPLMAVRGADGQLRAFHNVCRHRAGPLVEGEAGRCEGELVCRYHGWRYTLDGRLRSAGGWGGRSALVRPRASTRANSACSVCGLRAGGG